LKLWVSQCCDVPGGSSAEVAHRMRGHGRGFAHGSLSAKLSDFCYPPTEACLLVPSLGYVRCLLAGFKVLFRLLQLRSCGFISCLYHS
jgi:hypothetical protein